MQPSANMDSTNTTVILIKKVTVTDEYYYTEQ